MVFRGLLKLRLVIGPVENYSPLVYSLLHRAAASGLMVHLGQGKVSQYVYLMECVVIQLNSKEIREQMRNDNSTERIRAHYLLNEIEKIFMTLTKQVTGYQVISAAINTNMISSAPFNQALKRIVALPQFVDNLCQRELKKDGLVTLRLEKNPEAEARRPAAPVARHSANQVSPFMTSLT